MVGCQFQSRVTILADNYVGEDEVYLVTVYTGHGFGSGTSANVCVELNGSVGNSRVSAFTCYVKKISTNAVECLKNNYVIKYTYVYFETNLKTDLN